MVRMILSAILHHVFIAWMNFELNQAVNHHKLYEQLVLTCGLQLCETESLNMELPLLINDACTLCSCSHDCVITGDCCLDKFISEGVECVNTTIRNNYGDDSNSTTEDHFIMKNTCPDGTSLDLKENCEKIRTENDTLMNLPLTVNFYVSYKNKYCALCNNETDKYRTWSLNWDCRDFVDFNFISSYDSMFQNAKIKKCKLFASSDGLVKGCSKAYGSFVIKTCNVTGTWITYDPDIEWGCHNYDYQHDIFKNIFCLICNPSKHTKEIISTCNVTGLWDIYDDVIQRACVNLNSTSATYPYKNFFCYFCNKATEKYQKYRFPDIDAGFINTAILNGSMFQYTVDIEHLVKNAFFENFPEESTNQNNVSTLYATLNMTYITDLYYAVTGNSHFCSKYPHIGSVSGSCSCDEYCHFHGYNGNKDRPCCVDAAFRFSTTCTDPEPESFLLYDGCEELEPGYEYLREKCIHVFDGDLFSSLPVFDIYMQVSYRNAYCFLCRLFRKNRWFYPLFSDIPSIIDFNDLDPYDIQITCDSYLSLSYEPTFRSWLLAARKAGCRIAYQPYFRSVSLDYLLCSFYAKCSIHSQMTCLPKDVNGNDKDVSWACNNFYTSQVQHRFYNQLNSISVDMYKNAFCEVCNQPRRIDITEISTCNETGNWTDRDETTVANCLHFDARGYHHPYKNVFCKVCNGYAGVIKDNLTYESVICNVTFPENAEISYRSLFLLPSEFPREDDRLLAACDTGTVYDSIDNVCREILCFPGRISVNSSCVPFLSFTSNLVYTMAFGLKITHNVYIEDLKYLFAIMSNTIITSYFQTILDNPIVVEEFILYTKKSCLPGERWPPSTLMVSVYMRFRLPAVANRLLVENMLSTIVGSSFSIEQQYRAESNDYTYYLSESALEFDFIATVVNDENSIFMPSLVQITGLRDKCTYRYFENYIANSFYSPVYINELLTCPQIELKSHEFVFNEKTLFVTIKDLGEISHNHYFLTSNHGLRICVDTFERLVRSQDMGNGGFWDTIMVICTSVSLSALLFTFLTYCLLQELRTIPGKTNMGLCISLFGTLLLLQFGIKQTKYEYVCCAIAFATHYFCVCLFCSLNVCSFHAFRVFTSQSKVSINDEGRTVFRYFVYSFGLPFIVVSSTAVVSYVMTNDLSYIYGKHRCFIDNKVMFMAVFVGPVVLSSILNIIFYVLVAINIACTPKPNQGDINGPTNLDIVVYVKLFTLTGFSWGLQAVDSFFPLSYFSIIVSFMNSFEGIYMFLAFIANRRVLQKYQTYFRSFMISFKSKTSLMTK